MIESAEELVDKTLVFALAQVPHESGQEKQIATLAPLMILGTGEMIPFSSSVFPATGYVFWWDMPSGDWQPGDLVIGKLDRSTNYEKPDKSWYEVRGAKRVTKEVFEFICVQKFVDGGYRWLVDGRQSIELPHKPPSQFFVCTQGELIGPFKPDDIKDSPGGFSFVCKPKDSTDAFVYRYDGDNIKKITNDDHKLSKVTLSRNESVPGKHCSQEFVRKYLLICKNELEKSSPKKFKLQPDSLLISNLCSKRIDNRKEQRDLKKRLKEWLKQLKEEDQTNENDSIDGLESILRRAKLSDEVTERLAQSVIDDPKFKPEIDKALEKRIKEEVEKRKAEIEEKAQDDVVNLFVTPQLSCFFHFQ